MIILKEQFSPSQRQSY